MSAEWFQHHVQANLLEDQADAERHFAQVGRCPKAWYTPTEMCSKEFTRCSQDKDHDGDCAYRKEDFK